MEVSVYINHGGAITVTKGETFYLGGVFVIRHNLDPAKVGYNDLTGFVEEIGYREYVLYYRDYGACGLQEFNCQEHAVDLMTSKQAKELGMVQLYVVGKLAKNAATSGNAKAATSTNATTGTSKKRKNMTVGTPKRINLTVGTPKRANDTTMANVIIRTPKRANVTTEDDVVDMTTAATAGADVNPAVGADVVDGTLGAEYDDIKGYFEDAEIEDPDYLPVQESDTNDDLSDGDLSDDEEYKFARESKT